MKGINARLAALATILFTLFILATPYGAWAQGAPGSAGDYPSRTVRLVVPFAPGGVVDALARLMGPYMQSKLGQSFIVDNRPGGLTQIGIDVVVRSPNDGYTLLVTSSNVAIEQVVSKDWPFKVERDLTPISLFAGSGYAIVVPANAPFTNLRELIAYSKAHPGQLNQAQIGTISPDLAILKYRTGMAPVVDVLYKVGPAAVQAVVAGEAHFYGAALPDVLELSKAGKLRIIAYTEKERHPLIPDVPTVNESGVGLSDYDTGFWFALMGPAGMQPDVVNKLNTVMQDQVNTPDFAQRAGAYGFRLYHLSAPQSRERINATSRALEAVAAQGVKLR